MILMAVNKYILSHSEIVKTVDLAVVHNTMMESR